jgi:cytochrome b subunit of formate dehydrogenase
MFFQIFSILGIGVTLWWIYSSQKMNSNLKEGLGVWIKKHVYGTCQTLQNYKYLRSRDFFLLIKKLTYLLTILCVLILAVTGFIPVILLGQHLSGVLLILHVSVAPVFAICMALIALFWAHQNQFLPKDWLWFKRLFNQSGNKKLALSEKSISGEKVGYWLLLLISLPLILSILLSMFKFFGTDGQAFLLKLHGYCALFFVLIAIVHTYLIILNQKE